MPDVLGWTLIGILLLCLLVLIISVYLLYSGLLTPIEIRTGSAPVGSITVAYKYTQEGPNENALLQAECCRLAPHLPTITIYYDDPKKVRNIKSGLFIQISEPHYPSFIGDVWVICNAYYMNKIVLYSHIKRTNTACMESNLILNPLQVL